MTQEGAIGLIGTQGLVGVVEAADVTCKAANVQIVRNESIGGDFVTVMVKGDVAGVQAAVEAGAEAVTGIGGKLVVAYIIAEPHGGVTSLFPRQQHPLDQIAVIKERGGRGTMTPEIAERVQIEREREGFDHVPVKSVTEWRDESRQRNGARKDGIRAMVAPDPAPIAV